MILDTIIEHKRDELQRRQARRPLAAVRRAAEDAPPPLEFITALQAPGPQLIAELKRASPSKGVLRRDLNHLALADTYVSNGAAALSVLTDERFFRGRLQDLSEVKAAHRGTPVLRKDFVIDPYQVYEARTAGADVVLLIVAVLEDGALDNLLGLTRSLGMEALVEVHDEDELSRALRVSPRVIGINNRDLRNFTVSLSTTERLCTQVPDGVFVVSESGIFVQSDVARVAAAGADAVLVGEALVTAKDVAAKVRELAYTGIQPCK
jgi:indole-3-glycerol phosphate synthase